MPKLTALQVSRATKRGLIGDGGGLYLKITPTSTKSWVFRYRVGKKLRYHGLGSADTLSLAEAREKALACRKMRLEGIDPIEAKKQQRIAARLEAAKSISFEDCARKYIAAHKAGWSNPKHAWQWESTLSNYAFPEIGDLPVASVDREAVLKILEPIWKTKTETASRLRGRIEAILDWAKVWGYREGENPARWKGNLSYALPAKSKIAKVEHLPALPYAEIGTFWQALSKQTGTAANALRLTILTAARTGEVLGAEWPEFDLEQAVWTIPADRMKAGKEHRVPLSPEAVVVLEEAHKQRTGDIVFPGMKQGRPLSNMAMLKVLERMGRDNLTVHGFRSTFRDWAAERSEAPREVAEAALAHTLADKVEAAYRRSDLFEKRRALMDEWAQFCTS